MLLQPSLGLFHRGSICADNAPEAGRVIGLDEVSEFMHDDVVYDEHWGLDKAPVEIDTVIDRAGAPTIPIINDLGRIERYT